MLRFRSVGFWGVYWLLTDRATGVARSLAVAVIVLLSMAAVHFIAQREASVSHAAAKGPPLVEDGGFESGTGGGIWKENFNSVGSPMCNNAICGINSFAAPRSGDWWCWFGGVSGQLWKGSVSQKVRIPSAGSAELSFYLWIGHRSKNGKDYLKVTIDGDKIVKIKEKKKLYRDGYVQYVGDVSAYADGEKHNVKIFGKTTGFDGNGQNDGTNFNVDDVAIVTN